MSGHIKVFGVFAIVLLLVSVILGIWIGVAGKPYNTALFSVHKLAGIEFVALMVLITINEARSAGIFGVSAVLSVVAVASLATLLTTGAMMSGDKDVIAVLRVIHIFAVVLISLSCGILTFLLFNKN